MIHTLPFWWKVKQLLLKQVAGNSIPVICVGELDADNLLVLHHEHDGRDIDLNHANQVVKHIKDIWKDNVKLFTIIEDEIWEI